MQPVPEAIVSHSAAQGPARPNWPLQPSQAPAVLLWAAKPRALDHPGNTGPARGASAAAQLRTGQDAQEGDTAQEGDGLESTRKHQEGAVPQSAFLRISSIYRLNGCS